MQHVGPTMEEKRFLPCLLTEL